MGAAAMALTLSVLPASAQSNNLGRTLMRPYAKAQRAVKGASAIKDNRQVQVRRNVSQQSTLVSEDFSKFTAGSLDNPDTANWVVDFYGGDIDASLTQVPGWTGSAVHQAGGAACLTGWGMNAACINTPVGDYSGDLTITFRARRMNEVRPKNATINVNTLVGTFNSPSQADCDHAIQECRIFGQDKGWQDYTVTVKNYSSDNTGFIQIMTYDSIYLDDIVVKVSADSFIAEPTILPETNFTDTAFTVSWEPVRAANTYRLGLAKKVYTSDEEVVSRYYDFENGLPEDFTTTGEVEDGVGVDGSKALVLNVNESADFPSTGATYKEATAWLNLVATDTTLTADDLEYAQINCTLTRPDGSKDEGYFMASYFLNTPGLVSIIGEQWYGSTADIYSGIHFDTNNLPEGFQLIIDSVAFTTNRPYKMDVLFEPDDWYNSLTGKPAYVSAPTTTYTFTKLDASTEYYWTVQARRYTMNSKYTWHHAFGLAAPVAKVPTNLDERGSYTANWGPSAKATRYIVNNYGVYKAEADEEDHVVMDEPFDLVDATVTSADDPSSPESVGNDYAPSDLNDFTHQVGWVGMGNTMAQGYLGCAQAYTFMPYITSPALYLDNDTCFKLGLKVHGSPVDILVVTVNGNKYAVMYDENGDIDGEFTIPESGKNVKLDFTSYQYMAFMLDEVSVKQNLKKGDNVFTFLGSKEVAAPDTTCNFDGLSNYDYDLFAYDVVALEDLDNQTAQSESSGYVVFSLDPTAVKNVEGTDVMAKEVARYGIDGRQLSAPQKGVNIVKLSDGRVVKVIVK